MIETGLTKLKVNEKNMAKKMGKRTSEHIPNHI